MLVLRALRVAWSCAPLLLSQCRVTTKCPAYIRVHVAGYPGTHNQSLTIMILARGVLFCCIRLAGPLAHMAPPSPPPPLHGDYNDTTVTCVGRGCVSIPIFFILP